METYRNSAGIGQDHRDKAQRIVRSNAGFSPTSQSGHACHRCLAFHDHSPTGSAFNVQQPPDLHGTAIVRKAAAQLCAEILPKYVVEQWKTLLGATRLSRHSCLNMQSWQSKASTPQFYSNLVPRYSSTSPHTVNSCGTNTGH